MSPSERATQFVSGSVELTPLSSLPSDHAAGTPPATIVVIMLVLVSALAVRMAYQAISPIAGVARAVASAGAAFLLMLLTLALAMILLLGYV